jgi:hypothetical protein
LPGQFCDELEVLVIVQDSELGQLCFGSDEQVWDRCGTVVTALGQREPALVADPKVSTGLRRQSDLESGDGAESDQAA